MLIKRCCLNVSSQQDYNQISKQMHKRVFYQKPTISTVSERNRSGILNTLSRPSACFSLPNINNTASFHSWIWFFFSFTSSLSLYQLHNSSPIVCLSLCYISVTNESFLLVSGKLSTYFFSQIKNKARAILWKRYSKIQFLLNRVKWIHWYLAHRRNVKPSSRILLE